MYFKELLSEMSNCPAFDLTFIIRNSEISSLVKFYLWDASLGIDRLKALHSFQHYNFYYE